MLNDPAEKDENEASVSLSPGEAAARAAPFLGMKIRLGGPVRCRA
jgi:hypothetical protein